MESLMTIPLMTTIPIMDMALMPPPHIHSSRRAPKMSTTISERMIRGWMMDSNCAASIRYSSRMATTAIIISSRMVSLLEKYEPLKATSQVPSSTESSRAVAITPGTSESGMSSSRG